MCYDNLPWFRPWINLSTSLRGLQLRLVLQRHATHLSRSEAIVRHLREHDIKVCMWFGHVLVLLRALDSFYLLLSTSIYRYLPQLCHGLSGRFVWKSEKKKNRYLIHREHSENM